MDEDKEITIEMEEKIDNIHVVVNGITCQTCSNKVKNYVQKLKGVINIELNYFSQKGSIKYNPNVVSVEKIFKRIKDIGYSAELLDIGLGSGTITLKIENKKIDGEFEKKIEELLQKNECVLLSYLKKKRLLKIEFDESKTNPRHIISLCKKNLNVKLGPHVQQRITQEDSLMRKKEINYHFWCCLFSLMFTIPVFVIEVVILNIPSINYAPYVYYNNSIRINSTVGIGLSYSIWRSITPGVIILFLLATPVVFFFGIKFYVLGFKAVFLGCFMSKFRICRKINFYYLSCNADKNTLLTVSTWMSYIVSLISIIYGMVDTNYHGHLYLKTGAVLVTFLHLGALLENYGRRRTSSAILKLLELQPKKGRVVVNVENEQELKHKLKNEEKLVEEFVDISLVWKKEILKVIPGEYIPTDGIILSGQSKIDNSIITGESVPVDVSYGSDVIGGTLNLSSVIFLEVTKTINDNLLSEVLRTVENSVIEKTKLEELLLKITRYYVPFVLILAVLVYVLWLLLSIYVIPFEWRNGTLPAIYAILPSTSILVIACPCALGIAIPIIVLVSNGVGAKLGILFKGGRGIENLNKIDVFCFDKTGSLTEGKLSVDEVILNQEDDYWKDNIKELLFIIGSCENCVESHPIAKTLVSYVKQTTGYTEFKTPKSFEVIEGRGIKCEIDEEEILIGNRVLMEEHEVEINIEKEKVAKKTHLFISFDKLFVGAIVLTDKLKKEAKWVVQKLKKMKKDVVMLTGDNEGIAKKIGEEVGIEKIFSGMTPTGKAEKIKEFQKEKKKIAFLGDGINDSVGLTTADVSFSISSGSDIAVECSDVVLMKDSLYYVIIAMDLSKKAYIFMLLNLFWAFLYNILAFPFAGGCLYYFIREVVPPWVC